MSTITKSFANGWKIATPIDDDDEDEREWLERLYGDMSDRIGWGLGADAKILWEENGEDCTIMIALGPVMTDPEGALCDQHMTELEPLLTEHFPIWYDLNCCECMHDISREKLEKFAGRTMTFEEAVEFLKEKFAEKGIEHIADWDEEE